jgi:pheromone shutdown-related protein TraB
LTSENVHRLELDGKEIILIGTAHVSKKSVEEVKEIIEEEKPDTVCVELCQSRFQSITDANRWKNMDIVKVIKEGKAMMLLINLVLSSYQKRLGKQLGVQPGQEMIQGVQSANELGATLCLADRDIQTTLLRLWRGIGFWGKIKFFFQMVLSMFDDEEISEEELEKMKSQDMLTAALDELTHSFPQFKTILIDERDKYLAQKIKEAPGNKIIAVLGAGHIPGIKKVIAEDHDLKELSKVLPPSKAVKIIGWSIPILIIGLIFSTFTVDRSAGIEQIMSWLMWTGSLAALGTLLALGHPLTILTAFLVAPITALHPLLAAGWFAGLVEAMLRKPSVQDFENLYDDIYSWRGFWRNKVTHILLVVVFANLGSSMGTFIGGTEVIKQFIKTIF